MLRLLFYFILLRAVYCSCPTGFDLVRDGECRGKYESMNVYWDTITDSVITACKAIKGQTVIIHDDEQQSYWTSVAGLSSTSPPYNYVPLGLVCNSNTKKWEWADGTKLDYKPPSYNSDLDNDCISGYGWVMELSGSWGYGNGHGNTFTVDIFCTTQMKQPVPASDGCNSFEDDSEDGVCYQIGAAAESWQEAQLICSSFGASVASIHNQQENSFIRRLAVSHDEVSGLYLGATVSGKGNDLAWLDGSDWDYDNFFPGFPLIGAGSCLIMDTEGSSGQWVNVDCSSKLSVACMRQQNHSPPSCTSGPWKEGQIIYSPGFPFDASTPCDFILSVDAGKNVEMELLFLEANSCCDHLLIVENYFGGDVIADVTGSINNTIYTTSSSNFMRVSWLPNGGVNVRGMMMTFRGV